MTTARIERRVDTSLTAIRSLLARNELDFTEKARWWNMKMMSTVGSRWRSNIGLTENYTAFDAVSQKTTDQLSKLIGRKDA